MSLYYLTLEKGAVHLLNTFIQELMFCVTLFKLQLIHCFCRRRWKCEKFTTMTLSTTAKGPEKLNRDVGFGVLKWLYILKLPLQHKQIFDTLHIIKIHVRYIGKREMYFRIFLNLIIAYLYKYLTYM